MNTPYPSPGIQSHYMAQRDPQQTAWDSSPFTIYNDGINGASYTTPQGDSLSGRLNPGYPMLPPQPTAPQGIRAQLQKLLMGIPDLPRQAHQLPLHLGGVQAAAPSLDQAHQLPLNLQNHHSMVNAASSLAKFLAQQHTGTLRRFQYNGRH